MRRLSNLKTPLLALVFSVAAEIAVCILAFVAGRMGRPGEPVLFSRLWMLFHDLPDALSLWCIHQIRWGDAQSAGPEVARVIIFLLLAVLQWYFLFLVGISVYRRFSRKSV